MMEKVEEVVEPIIDGKSLGPDIFIANLFHHLQDMINNEVWTIVENSRRSEQILSVFNGNFLTLIQKSEGVDSPGIFRPIVLCNIIYKIVTNVITKILNPIIPNQISPEQSRFVEGRQIMDGIILVHEVAHSLKTERISGMMPKLNIAKAYNKLSWQYIGVVLRVFIFTEDWIR